MTTVTATEPPLLPLLWLASPALPVGGFSYSEGLEAAVDAGLVQGEAQARDWLVEQLHLTLSRGDLAVIASAWSAWHAGDATRLRELDDWVLQTRETAELRQQTLQMGRSLIEWLRVVHPDAADRAADMHWTDGSPTWPVAWSIALAASGARARDGLLAHAFGWAENMMQAAIKAVPLGQSAGQRMLAALAAEIPSAVDHALSLDDTTRQAFSPRLAILSAHHESQYSRLFRS